MGVTVAVRLRLALRVALRDRDLVLLGDGRDALHLALLHTHTWVGLGTKGLHKHHTRQPNSHARKTSYA